jgi:site-specific DNA-methyltransferase (adenine-specific)
MFNLKLGDQKDLFDDVASDSIDAIITDPPYNLSWGHKIESKFDILLFLESSFRVLKPNGFLVYFGQEPSISQWNVLAMENLNGRFKYLAEIIWYKGRHSSPVVYPLRTHEKIMIFTKGNGKLNPARIDWATEKQELFDYQTKETIIRRLAEWKKAFSMVNTLDELKGLINADGKKARARTKANDSAYDWGSCDYKGRKDFISLTDKKLTTMWGCKPHNHQGYRNEEFNVKHPTVKPIQILERLIEMTTQDGNLILDPFTGSGTTGVACKNMGREFLGFELFEEYFDIAKKRIEHEKPVELRLFND